MVLRAGLTVALGSFLLVAAASAAPGQLDASFSGDGWVRTSDVRGAPSGAGATGLALQPDGKIITVGPLPNGFGAFRWLPNGDLDPGFGSGGLAVARNEQDDEAHTAAVQRDGKVVLAGRGACRLLWCAMVVRLSPDGRLDGSFGAGGVAVADRTACPAAAVAVALQPDGKVIVAGSRPSSGPPPNDDLFALARFTASGRLDSTFSRDGCISIEFSSVDDRAQAVLVQRDGRILAAGMGTGRGRTLNDFAFVRLLRNGTLDRTFSHDGRQTVDFGRDRLEMARGIAVQPNGRIVAVGFTGPHSSAGRLTAVLARLRRNGSLDRSFGSRGRMLLRASRVESFATDVAVVPGGRILVAGGALEGAGVGSSSSWFLARLRSNGQPDRGWGAGGLALGDFGTGEDWAAALAVQRDGRVVVAGKVYGDQGLARYLSR